MIPKGKLLIIGDKEDKGEKDSEMEKKTIISSLKKSSSCSLSPKTNALK
uniref:Uncharacterized protein n=1 Tax=Chryseobacterium endophyticum TaxID=1854762 RepID=A0AAU6WST0_9FLAO